MSARSRVHAYSFSLGPVEGKPGDAVTLRSVPAITSEFRPRSLMMSDGTSEGGMAIQCFREIRFPRETELRIDGGLCIDGRLGYGGTCAAFLVGVGVAKGDVIEVDVVIPASGKIYCAIFGDGRE